jgi:hypothetical protein
MNLPTNDLRGRLRELLAIPERDRTDEQWDAIVAIEIELGPGKAAVVAQQKSIAANQNGGAGQQPNLGPRRQNKGKQGHRKPGGGKKPQAPKP